MFTQQQVFQEIKNSLEYSTAYSRSKWRRNLTEFRGLIIGRLTQGWSFTDKTLREHEEDVQTIRQHFDAVIADFRF